MIHGALSRVLAAPDSPTADLYFVNACGDFLHAGVVRLGPTVFASRGVCLVMRHDLRARPAGRRRPIYFVDDAVEEGVGDASLPFLYRQKLRLVERTVLRRLAPGAAAVVASSAALAERYADGAEAHALDPYWSEPLAGAAHFAPLLRGEGWVEIAYLGSAVHRADLAFLWPAVVAVLASEPRVRFHIPERHSVPHTLAGHPRILRIPGRGWTAYRAGLAERRFHIALYPLLDTPFNRGRSVNKLIEHAVVGAAPLYSRSWAEGRRAEAAGAGLALANAPGHWQAAIRHLVARPAATWGLAAGAAALARRLNRPGPQRRLWASLLGLADRAG